MSIIRIEKHTENYAIIHKQCLEDERISYRARGLFACLMSKPNDWRISLSNLAHHTKEGRTAIATAMDELIKYGYATRCLSRNTDGTINGWETIIHEAPNSSTAEPKSGFLHSVDPTSAEPISDNLPHTKNTDTKDTITKNTEDFKHKKDCAEKNGRNIPEEANRVLAYFKSMCGGNKWTDLGEIPGCLKRGATVQTCNRVIEWALKCVDGTPKFLRATNRVNQFTLFRKVHFAEYLQDATDWHAQGSLPHGATSSPATHADLVAATARFVYRGPSRPAHRCPTPAEVDGELFADDDEEQF